VVEPNLLEGKANNYLASVVFEGERAGIAYTDITTGEFFTMELPLTEALTELERLKPSEILIPRSSSILEGELPVPRFFGITRLDDRWFELDTCRQTLIEHFKADSLTPYGCEHLPLSIRAAGSIIYYLNQIQRHALEQLTRLNTYSPESFMEVDPQTIRNLEVFQSSLGSTSGSLLSVIDFTRTPMGGRLLKKWLRQPLLDIKELTKRQDAIQWFYNNALDRSNIESLLGQVFDIERLIGRVKSGIATPRELVALGRSLEAIPKIINTLEKGQEILKEILSKFKPCDDIPQLISRAVFEDPPAGLDRGGVIKDGYSKELDQLRSLLKNSRKYMADLET
jgi:DNA mismatch repair protein MutS